MAEENRLERDRRAKVARWRADGKEPYPWSFPDRSPTTTVRSACERLNPGETATGTSLRVAGRLMAIRQHGRTAFADLEDLSGSLQLLLRVDELGEASYQAWLADLDPGDIVGELHPGRGFRGAMLDSRLDRDLGIDSLDFLDVAFAIDKAFGIKLPLEQWTQEVNDGKATTDQYFVLKNLSTQIDQLIAAKGA
jgi:acyl carrier protein